MQNNDLTVHVIASQERVSANYIYRLLRLPTLAPDIIRAIVNGKNPPQLTAKRLMRLTPQIPVGWAEQSETTWLPIAMGCSLCGGPALLEDGRVPRLPIHSPK
jgi:hypothetical protein